MNIDEKTEGNEPETAQDGVLEGDINTSMSVRNPQWDFAKLSGAERRGSETYFQPLGGVDRLFSHGFQ